MLRRGHLLAPLLAAYALSACQICPEPRPCPSLPSLPSLSASTSPTVAAKPAQTAPTTERSLHITLAPAPNDATLRVEVVARGAPEELSSWCLDDRATQWTLDSVHAGDKQLDAHKTDTGATVDNRSGPVRVIYRVSERTTPDGGLPAVEIMPDLFQASGMAVLLLPCAFSHTVLPIHIRQDLSNLHPHGRKGGASSFGPGDREVRTTGHELRLASFAAGTMGTAVFDALEGRDEAAWFGYMSFDPRPISADVAAFRTAVAQSLGPPAFAAETLLMVADGRRIGTFRARRRGRGVLVHVGTGQPWSAGLRVAVAKEVLHGWIGTQLWLGPRAQERQAESFWFSEGVTRHLARDMLFRFGLLTPEEVLGEVHGLVETVVTSPLCMLSNHDLAQRVSDPEALKVLVAKGALYAARVDRLIRKQSEGRRDLPDVLKKLLATARAGDGVLPVNAWAESVSEALGTDESGPFESFIRQGRPVVLPPGVLGPCFDRIPRFYARYDLGFDRVATWKTSPRRAVGVRSDGPAYQAGLREGDSIVDADNTQGSTNEPVLLTIDHAGVLKKVAYQPRGATTRGFGWRRNRVPDAECQRY